MDLTLENKAHIDSLSYESLLHKWRFSPSGEPWFQGETGKYWGERMNELKRQNPAEAVASSKRIGWMMEAP